MYNARSFDEIIAELKEYSDLPASKVEGTFENDVLASNAIEFAKAEAELEECYKAAFLDTSQGEYLDLNTNQVGIFRKEATKAIGVITVYGRGTVPAGSYFTTIMGTGFITTEEKEIDGEGDIPVECTAYGEIGNVAAETIINIPMSIPGITGVTNKEPAHDGYDVETDEELSTRALEHVRNPGTSGNPRHYIEWATSISGVGSARCIRAWNGPNTVKVIIIDSNYEEASAELIQEVADYIDERRTVNAIVTVTSAKPVVIDVAVETDGLIDSEYLEALIKEYFGNVERKAWSSTKQPAIILNKIGTLVLEAGAEDYNSILLNGKVQNIVLDLEELPKLGRVIINGS